MLAQANKQYYKKGIMREKTMNMKQIWSVYWSATGNTKTVVNEVAGTLAEKLGCPLKTIDFTLPAAREAGLSFAEGDLVVIGTPTYAGKLPNKMLPYIQEQIKGNGALAVGIVTFGNRSFDNSLAELCAVLEKNGFHTVSAGAFSCRHAFTDKLADGRPNEADLSMARELAVQTAEKVKKAEDTLAPVTVPGDADAPYYVPKGTDGQPAKFLKAKPKMDPSKCTQCGICARVCPMGSIDLQDASNVPGVCIKCQACIRSCPEHARYFDDAAFLSHVAMLEENFTEPKENQIFS